MSASPKASVLLPANARACDFEVESGDEPERSVAFRSGTVPFTLQCWTDSALAHYSGTALYETDFQMPRDARGKNLALDLGAVGLAAEAWVNGKKVGERAWRPFWFDISKAVRARNNTLRIRVANSNAGWEAQGGTIYGKGSWGLKYNTERDRLATLHPNGLGEPALADAIRELDASCIVLDFWGNPSAEQYAAALPVFVDRLREKRPEVPILVTSPFYFPSEESNAPVARSQATKRRFAHDFVESRRKKGDHKITFVDGFKMLNRDQTSGLVDGVHCNSLGFYFNAQGLEPFLKKALRGQ